MTGKVWLVGAGPSDTGLLTIKGKQVIEEAEVVVYDALVSQGILGLIPDCVQAVCAGKRAGSHTMPQEEINRLLVRLAEQGKRVVRLKGGDPFLFGRGGEEAEALAAHGIPFEVVPGVTSAVAAAAYAGIPVTHRDFASSVHIITGHKKKEEALCINFRALVQAGGTCVFLMGVSSLPAIVNGFLEAGMEPDMPAAIVEQAATGRQKKVIATLAALEEEAGKSEIKAPAVIIIGRVAGLGKRLAWFEKLPLSGRRFLITGPGERGNTLSEELRKLGAEVWKVPVIVIRERHPNMALRAELEHLKDYRFLVFTSPSGVTAFMKELLADGKDVRYLAGVSIAVIGTGTKKAFLQYGLCADLMPEIYNGEALGRLLAENCEAGDKVLAVRSSLGNPALITEIRKEKEIAVTDIPLYDVSYQKSPFLRTGGAALAEEADGIFFTSASTVRGFAELCTDLDFSGVSALCIGEMTACEAKKYGMDISVAKEASINGLVELALSRFGTIST